MIYSGRLGARALLSAAMVLGAGLGTRAHAQENPGSGLGPLYALDNGDVNGDWDLDLSDPIYLLRHLYSGGPAPVPAALCVGADLEVKNGDADGDGFVDLSDGIHLLSWLFLDGQPPVDTCETLLGLGEGGNAGKPKQMPRIAPVGSRPFGKTYEQWSIEFWRWSLSIPADQNPFFTGNCTVPQRGKVWFIAGAFNTTPTCTIPKGKAIFFPLIGTENDFPCPDPNFKPAPGQSLEDFLTVGVKAFMDPVTNVELFIDGVSAGNMNGQRVTSHLFTFTGDLSLVAGFDPCITGQKQQAVSDGYWVMVHRLTPGVHTLLVKVDMPGQHFETNNIITIDKKGDGDGEEGDEE